MEARHDAGFTLSSLNVDVSVAPSISDQVQADYTKTSDPLVGEIAFSVRFEGRVIPSTSSSFLTLDASIRYSSSLFRLVAL